jgi:hypothetical protein
MARVVRLSPLFRRRLDALGVLGAERAAVGATLASLAEAKHLPGVLDTSAAIPPTHRAYVRRVAGRNLWIWYRASANEIVAVTITRAPAVPSAE